MTARIFIDGEHGTTGLQIRERLASRDDIEVLSIAHDDRRDNAKRLAIFVECDVAILCLPDDAAREAVSMIESSGNANCAIIDTSTAHRTNDNWAFGFAELDADQPARIASSKRISNPGCYSTGAIALLKPLIANGLMASDLPVTINAVSGYTGGGKQLIAQMEDPNHAEYISTSFHAYALPMKHKHVPEIMIRSGLEKRPIFTPAVGRFAQGMLVNIPIHLDLLKDGTNAATLSEVLTNHYQGSEFVSVATIEEAQSVSTLKPEDFAGRDDMKLWIFGDADTGHVNLIAQLDNLGKGASGAAVQNLNIILGS